MPILQPDAGGEGEVIRHGTLEALVDRIVQLLVLRTTHERRQASSQLQYGRLGNNCFSCHPTQEEAGVFSPGEP